MNLQTKWDAKWVSNSEGLVFCRRCKRGMDQHLHMRVRDRHHKFCLSSGCKDLAVWVIFPLNPFVRLRPRNSAGENVISINNAFGTARQSPVWSQFWTCLDNCLDTVLTLYYINMEDIHIWYEDVWYKMQDGREASAYNSKRSYPTSPFVLLAFSIHQQKGYIRLTNKKLQHVIPPLGPVDQLPISWRARKRPVFCNLLRWSSPKS